MFVPTLFFKHPQTLMNMSTQVGCIFVTTLLHYLFLSVFCWTLCEGNIMFIMFYSVFYHGFFKHLYFYLLICWGKKDFLLSCSAEYLCISLQVFPYHQLHCQSDYHTKTMESMKMIRDWRKQIHCSKLQLIQLQFAMSVLCIYFGSQLSVG